MTDTRYPYTYAADLVRSFVGPHLSRSEASSVWHGIAEALGLDERETAEKLANYYELHEEEFACTCYIYETARALGCTG